MYVTAEAKSGDAILTKTLNRVWANALLNNASIKTNPIDFKTSLLSNARDEKSENINIIIAGGRIDKKIPAVTAAGGISVR